MFIGSLVVAFRLHGLTSLKEKRAIAGSMKQKLRNKFNLAVSETEGQDDRTRLVLGLVTVSSDKQRAESILNKAMTMIEAMTSEEIVEVTIEVIAA